MKLGILLSLLLLTCPVQGQQKKGDLGIVSVSDQGRGSNGLSPLLTMIVTPECWHGEFQCKGEAGGTVVGTPDEGSWIQRRPPWSAVQGYTGLTRRYLLPVTHPVGSQEWVRTIVSPSGPGQTDIRVYRRQYPGWSMETYPQTSISVPMGRRLSRLALPSVP